MSLRILRKLSGRAVFGLVLITLLVTMLGVAQAAPEAQRPGPAPKFSTAKAFDVSPALRDLAGRAALRAAPPESSPGEPREIRPERGPAAEDRGFSGDGAVQAGGELRAAETMAALAIPAPTVNFEGMSNQDNFNLFGFRVNPPDPVGDVGPNHYVEMVNLAFAVYDKQGNLLLGPVPIGALWEGFAVEDCTDPSGDPIVIYDQLEDRWILSQFTTRDPIYYNCVAISQTGDPTGAYYRYAFTSGVFFPDYPKYGVWTNSR